MGWTAPPNVRPAPAGDSPLAGPIIPRRRPSRRRSPACPVTPWRRESCPLEHLTLHRGDGGGAPQNARGHDVSAHINWSQAFRETFFKVGHPRFPLTVS